MIINTGKKQYKIIRDIFLGAANDVYVCQEVNNQIKDYKTLWMIKDREIAKNLLQEFDACRQPKDNIYTDCFMIKDHLCFTFPYSQERPLNKFYLSVVKNGIQSREQIWMELVTKCMTSTMPDTFLKLFFLQDQVQISQDGAIYFNYVLDLSQYPDLETKSSSVVLCAEKLIDLIRMEQNHIDNETLHLLEYKLGRAEYSQYIQLYKDMKILTQPRDKKSYKELAAKWYSSKKDTVFHILAVISIVLIVVLVLFLITKLIFGDFILFRLFSRPIVQIGTESLLQ